MAQEGDRRRRIGGHVGLSAQGYWLELHVSPRRSKRDVEGARQATTQGEYTMSKRIMGFLAPILATVMWASVAAASENEKVFPGAQCQTSNQTDAINRTVLGGMRNASSATQTWVCPIVRDSVTGSIEFAEIALFGRASATCKLVSSTSSGLSFAETTPSAVVPLRQDRRRLQYAGGDQNFSPASRGAVFFVCTMSPGSGVGTYRVVENEGED